MPLAPKLTGSLAVDLRGSATEPLAASERGLEVANTKAGAVVQPAAQGSCNKDMILISSLS